MKETYFPRLMRICIYTYILSNHTAPKSLQNIQDYYIMCSLNKLYILYKLHLNKCSLMSTHVTEYCVFLYAILQTHLPDRVM